jgi:hypothetical protein
MGALLTLCCLALVTSSTSCQLAEGLTPGARTIAALLEQIDDRGCFVTLDKRVTLSSKGRDGLTLNEPVLFVKHPEGKWTALVRAETATLEQDQEKEDVWIVLKSYSAIVEQSCGVVEKITAANWRIPLANR